jgi:hypothetical protein
VRIDEKTGSAYKFVVRIEKQHRVCAQCAAGTKNGRQCYMPIKVSRAIAIENKKTALSCAEDCNFIERTIFGLSGR